MHAGPARRALPGGVLICDDPLPDLARLLNPSGAALIIQGTRQLAAVEVGKIRPKLGRGRRHQRQDTNRDRQTLLSGDCRADRVPDPRPPTGQGYRPVPSGQIIEAGRCHIVLQTEDIRDPLRRCRQFSEESRRPSRKVECFGHAVILVRPVPCAYSGRVALRGYHLYGSREMAKRKPSETKPPETGTPPPRTDEFVVGKSEFRVGRPEFRIGDPSPESPTEFRVGTPVPPTEAPKARPELPKGWAHVPTQPPWRLLDPPAEGPSDDLRRIENPKKRYRGLAALKAYLDPDHVEEIIDLLVYRADKGEPGPGSISGFIKRAVQTELPRRRQADNVGDRYPDHTRQGLRPKRGARPGQATRAPSPQSGSRPVVARLPEALVEEVRDCVIHQNGGDRDGPHTVSRFVGDSVQRQLQDERVSDGIKGRYPSTTVSARAKHLDPRTTRPNR